MGLYRGAAERGRLAAGSPQSVAGGEEMTSLGDDLIHSLKEALTHAMGDGRGIEHAPASPRGPETGDVPADAVDTDDKADLSGVGALARQVRT